MNPNPTNNKLRANLWKLNIFYGVKAALLMIPILVPFFQSHGLSLRDVFWLQGLFGVAVLLLEVPSGYISDRLGRRRTLFVGTIFLTLGMGVYPLMEGFYGFLFAELLLGVGCSFISGSDSALTWETLEALGESNDYNRVVGRQRFIASNSEAVASIIGAALAVISMQLPLVVQAVVFSFTIPLALSLTEVDAPAGPDTPPPPSLRTILVETFALDRELRHLLLLAAIISVSTLSMVWYCQPWFGEAGFPLAAFGVLWAVLRLGVGVSSLFAHRVLERFGLAMTIRLVIALLAIGYAGAALFQHPVGYLAILLFSVVRGLSMVAFLEAVNRRIPGDRRATVLSCQNLLVRLMFAPLSPLLGWMADWWSLGVALAASGLLFSVGSALLFLLWRRSGPSFVRSRVVPA